MGILVIEEEYWTTQYLTNVTGERKPIFWPLDGEGKHATEAAAEERADVLLDIYASARVVHVVRRMEYRTPVVRTRTDGP